MHDGVIHALSRLRLYAVMTRRRTFLRSIKIVFGFLSLSEIRGKLRAEEEEEVECIVRSRSSSKRTRFYPKSVGRLSFILVVLSRLCDAHPPPSDTCYFPGSGGERTAAAAAASLSLFTYPLGLMPAAVLHIPRPFPPLSSTWGMTDYGFCGGIQRYSLSVHASVCVCVCINISYG